MSSDIQDSQELGWSKRSDTELYLELQKGHQAALGTLYDRYARLIYTIALKVLKNPQEAEDLTQDIFLNLYQKQNYDPTRGSLVRFLSTVARTRSLDRLRSRGIRHRILRAWQPQRSPAERLPEEHASRRERSDRVHRALQQLPTAQRRVLEMAYFSGYSQSEIAEQLGIPLGTVKYRARQGLTKLKMHFESLQDWS